MFYLKLGKISEEKPVKLSKIKNVRGKIYINIQIKYNYTQ